MKYRFQVGAGIALAGFLIWLLFRNADAHEIWAATTRASMAWVLMSMGLVVVTSCIRAKRWSYIIRTAKPSRYRHVFSAMQIGIMADFLLPARVGELIQAAALSRLVRLPLPKAIAMTALDRVLDLISLLVIMAVTLTVYTPADCVIPRETFGWRISVSAGQIQMGEYIAGALFILIIAFFVLLFVNQVRVLRWVDSSLSRFLPRIAKRVHGILEHFVEGLHILGNTRSLVKSLAFSALTWGFNLLSIIAMLKAFDIRGPWYMSFVLIMLVMLTISVPATPALIGQFQVPIVVGLVTLTSADDPTAKAVSITAYASNLTVSLVLGLLSLYRERTGLAGLSLSSVMAGKEKDRPPVVADGDQ